MFKSTSHTEALCLVQNLSHLCPVAVHNSLYKSWFHILDARTQDLRSQFNITRITEFHAWIPMFIVIVCRFTLGDTWWHLTRKNTSNIQGSSEHGPMVTEIHGTFCVCFPSGKNFPVSKAPPTPGSQRTCQGRQKDIASVNVFFYKKTSWSCQQFFGNK